MGDKFVFVLFDQVYQVVRDDFVVFFYQFFDWVVDFVGKVFDNKVGGIVCGVKVGIGKFGLGGIDLDGWVFVFEVFFEVFEKLDIGVVVVGLIVENV